MGLFDPQMMQELQQMMAQFGATPEERKSANNQALFALGFGLLQGQKGQELSGIGRAGAGAMMYRNNLLADIPKQKMDAFGAAGKVTAMAEQLRAIKDQQEFRNFQTRGGTSVIPDPGSGVPQNAASGVPQGTASGQVASSAYDPSAALLDEAKQHDAAYKTTRNPLFLQARDKALTEWQKLREEYSAPIVATVGNKPTYVRPGKYGGQQTMQGVDPPPDFMTVDRGGQTDIINKLNLPMTGQSLPKSMSPEGAASNQIALAHLGLARNADKRASDAAAIGGKPQWDSTAGMFVYPPTAENPSGKVAQPEGFNKIPKPLTESQSKNALYLGMMKTASEGIDKITGLSNAEISLARGDASYVPQFVQNIAAGEKAQKYAQGSLQWTEAMLRITTGATAPKEEVIRTSKTFFPQIGDGPEVIAQKAARRSQMEKMVAIGAGRGADQVNHILGSGWSAVEIK